MAWLCFGQHAIHIAGITQTLAAQLHQLFKPVLQLFIVVMYMINSRVMIHAVGVMTTYWCSWHRYSNMRVAICQMHCQFFIQNPCDLRKIKECLRHPE